MRSHPAAARDCARDAHLHLLASRLAAKSRERCAPCASRRTPDSGMAVRACRQRPCGHQRTELRGAGGNVWMRVPSAEKRVARAGIAARPDNEGAAVGGQGGTRRGTDVNSLAGERTDGLGVANGWGGEGNRVRRAFDARAGAHRLPLMTTNSVPRGLKAKAWMGESAQQQAARARGISCGEEEVSEQRRRAQTTEQHDVAAADVKREVTSRSQLSAEPHVEIFGFARSTFPSLPPFLLSVFLYALLVPVRSMLYCNDKGAKIEAGGGEVWVCSGGGRGGGGRGTGEVRREVRRTEGRCRGALARDVKEACLAVVTFPRHVTIGLGQRNQRCRVHEAPRMGGRKREHERVREEASKMGTINREIECIDDAQRVGKDPEMGRKAVFSVPTRS